MFNGRLVRQASTNDYLRTKEVVGECPEPPKVGQSFVIYAPPIDASKDVRVVTTSTVQSVETSGATTLFKTLNSTYMLYREGNNEGR